jgi:hypothetical protein
MSLDRILRKVEVADEGVVEIPFGFQINGTSNPDNLVGDLLLSVVRSAAGKFTCTLAPNNKPFSCFYGHAEVSSTADGVDLVGKLDWSSVATNGTFVVRTLTGTVQTDPADNTFVGGSLRVKKVDRKAVR